MSRAPARPPEGYPWERPGHRFFRPGFPPGYVPRLADHALLSPNESKKQDRLDGIKVEEEKY